MGQPPPEESLMPYSGLLLYTLADHGETPEIVSYSLHCLGVHAEGYTRHQDTNVDHVNPEALHSLEEDFWLDRLVLRFRRTLSSTPSLDNSTLNTCLLSLWVLASSPLIQCLLLKHRVFEAVNHSIRLQHENLDVGQRLRVWAIGLDILRCELFVVYVSCSPASFIRT